jgi:hypothetical protein
MAKVRGHLGLAQHIYGEKFPQRIVPNARTFVNVVEHLRDFTRLRRSHLAEEEEILHVI